MGVAVVAAMAIISAASAISSGAEQKKALRRQADDEEKQAKIEEAQAVEQAGIRSNEVAREEDQQQASFLGRGVSAFSGTPLQILAETRRIGQQDVNSILTTGKSRSDLLNRQAGRTRNQGNAALLGGFGQAAGIGFNSLGYFNSIAGK